MNGLQITYHNICISGLFHKYFQATKHNLAYALDKYNGMLVIHNAVNGQTKAGRNKYHWYFLTRVTQLTSRSSAHNGKR